MLQSILNKIIKPVNRESVVAKVEEYCGDEMAHGQNQALSSLSELRNRLSFSEEKTRKPQCFLVDCTGFWEEDLSNNWKLTKVLSAEELASTRIPLYIYALKEGSGYKVAFSSRYFPEFTQNDFGYYTEILGALSTHPVKNDISVSFMMKSATYSSDLLSILDSMAKKGQVHAVYRLV